MTTKTHLEDLRQLSVHAQCLVEQSRLLAQRADHLASQWPSEQAARPGRGVPAADLETLNTELTRQLVVERAHGEDYGPGIPAPALPHLFSRFYQAEQRERPSQQGLGLGLFICHQLVAAHKGSITVRSCEGAGSVFTVRLPLLPDAMRTACDANGADATPGRSSDPRGTRMSRGRMSPGAIAWPC
jgi:hypothetical protein